MHPARRSVRSGRERQYFQAVERCRAQTPAVASDVSRIKSLSTDENQTRDRSARVPPYEPLADEAVRAPGSARVSRAAEQSPATPPSRVRHANSYANRRDGHAIPLSGKRRALPSLARPTHDRDRFFPLSGIRFVVVVIRGEVGWTDTSGSFVPFRCLSRSG